MRIGLKQFFPAFFLIICANLSNFGQSIKPTHVIDSLSKILAEYDKDPSDHGLADTVKINLLNKLSYQYFKISDKENMFKNVTRANELCLKLLSVPSYSNNYTLKREFGRSYHFLSNYYEIAGMLPKAFDNYFKASKVREEIGDMAGIAESSNNGGNLYKEQGDLAKALELYTRALKVREEILKTQPGNKSNLKGIAGGYNNIGLLFKKQKNYEKALSYFLKALEIKESIHDNLSAASSLGNIGMTYTSLKNYPLALQYCTKALKIYEEYGDKRGASTVYYNIGLNFAEEAFDKGTHNSAALFEESKKNIGIALAAAKQTGDISLIKDCYETLSRIMEYKKDFGAATEYYKLFILFRDSLNSFETTQNLVRAQMNNEFEKKVLLAKQKQEENDVLRHEEHERQKTLRNLFIVAFAFMLILAVFIFISYRQKQRDHILVSQQKKEVEEQKALAEQKQKQIIDSINYAKRIQASILPHHEKLRDIFPLSFILFLPKDIVSGDFYWYHVLPDSGKVFVAVADCTGHGVPGAFLSMVGSTLLNEIIIHKEITDPARIIKELSYGLSLVLMNKEDSEVDKDGMDVTLCIIDPNKYTVTYAAANQPIYISGKKGLKKIEPQINSPEGIFDLNATVTLRSNEIQLTKGEYIYLLTDGYPSHFQESKQFETILSEINSLPPQEQKSELQKALAQRGEVTDDILVLGIKI